MTDPGIRPDRAGRSEPAPERDEIDRDEIDRWLAELAAALGVDPDSVDRALLLDVARDAAHGVARPAAPLTTFLVGLAAGLRGGSASTVRELADLATALATNRPPGP